jgi:hypothetical protein
VAGREWVTHADFVGLVGEEFELPERGQALRLVEATEHDASGGQGPGGEDRRQFSLVFEGPLEDAFDQATVLVRHDELGTLHVFLVPLGPRADSMRYEAAFA